MGSEFSAPNLPLSTLPQRVAAAGIAPSVTVKDLSSNGSAAKVASKLDFQVAVSDFQLESFVSLFMSFFLYSIVYVFMSLLLFVFPFDCLFVCLFLCLFVCWTWQSLVVFGFFVLCWALFALCGLFGIICLLSLECCLLCLVWLALAA